MNKVLKSVLTATMVLGMEACSRTPGGYTAASSGAGKVFRVAMERESN